VRENSSRRSLFFGSSLSGAGRPGLLIKVKGRELYLAVSAVEERAMPVSSLEGWVLAIASIKEGFPLAPEDPVLLEFSMNSEEEVEEEEQPKGKGKEEAVSLAKSVEQAPAVDPAIELALAREREEDAKALENLTRSWESPKKRHLCQTLVRTCNYLNKNGDRARSLNDFADGVQLVHLLRSLGLQVDIDPAFEGRSRYENATKVHFVQAAVTALARVFPVGAEHVSAALVVSGIERAIASLLWAILYSQFVKPTEFGGLQGMSAVAAFVMQSVAGHEHVRITSDLAASFCNSFALNAILHRYCPNAVDYDVLQPAAVERNLRRCFDKAHELLRVPLLLEAVDFLDPREFDELSLVLYLAAFARAVAGPAQV
jgi:hypothetical protein